MKLDSIFGLGFSFLYCMHLRRYAWISIDSYIDFYYYCRCNCDLINDDYNSLRMFYEFK